MYIDLSVTLNPQTPVYPGDPAVVLTPTSELERDGWNDYLISVNNHIGTHIDAPLHMLAGGKTLDAIPVEQFAGKGRLVDATKGFTLDAVQAAGLQAGDIVLFYTGMGEQYHQPAYFVKYPAMSEEIAAYLIACRVSMVGVDACSVDNIDGFPIHKQLLSNDVLIIENLTNLAALQGKDFNVYALPVKLDLDGAPARVIAQTV